MGKPIAVPKRFKVAVPTKEESITLQEAAIKAGYRWHNSMTFDVARNELYGLGFSIYADPLCKRIGYWITKKEFNKDKEHKDYSFTAAMEIFNQLAEEKISKILQRAVEPPKTTGKGTKWMDEGTEVGVEEIPVPSEKLQPVLAPAIDPKTSVTQLGPAEVLPEACDACQCSLVDEAFVQRIVAFCVDCDKEYSLPPKPGEVTTEPGAVIKRLEERVENLKSRLTGLKDGAAALRKVTDQKIANLESAIFVAGKKAVEDAETIKGLENRIVAIQEGRKASEMDKDIRIDTLRGLILDSVIRANVFEDKG